ncbi:Hypothetical predicted protein, partial [Pelobates cultripes]
CGSRGRMEAPPALRDTSQGGQPDQELIRGNDLHSDPRKTACQQLLGEDWSPTMMLIIPVPLPHRHRLDLSTFNRGRNLEEKMELDRAYPMQTTHQHHQAGLQV